MPPTISALVPNPSDLLSLEPAEVAGVILAYIHGHEAQSGSSVVQHGKVSFSNFFNELHQRPPYASEKEGVKAALLEGWSWLVNDGLLVRDPDQPGAWYLLSRRAKLLKSGDEFNAYRQANRLPHGQLHPRIATLVFPAFLRGEYDTAIFQAFREIEIAVREHGDFPADLLGTHLMREAFRPAKAGKVEQVPGILTDSLLPAAEQQAMSDLFAGAIGLYKNPQSHRYVAANATDAAEVIMFASQLLRTIERLKVAEEGRAAIRSV